MELVILILIVVASLITAVVSIIKGKSSIFAEVLKQAKIGSVLTDIALASNTKLEFYELLQYRINNGAFEGEEERIITEIKNLCDSHISLFTSTDVEKVEDMIKKLRK